MWTGKLDAERRKLIDAIADDDGIEHLGPHPKADMEFIRRTRVAELTGIAVASPDETISKTIRAHNERFMTCPTCKGEKRVLSMYERPGSPPGNGWIACPHCNATGEVPKEHVPSGHSIMTVSEFCEGAQPGPAFAKLTCLTCTSMAASGSCPRKCRDR